MSILPVLPIRDTVIFPGVIAPLFVGRQRSLRSLEEASVSDKNLLVVAQRENTPEDPSPEELYGVGTLCQVIQMVRIPDGSTKVLIEGNSRAFVTEYIPNADYLSADVVPIEFEGGLSQ